MKYKVIWVYYSDQGAGGIIREGDFYSNLISAFFKALKEMSKGNTIEVSIRRHDEGLLDAC